MHFLSRRWSFACPMIDAIRTAIGLGVGAPICVPHACNLCGKSADKFGRTSWPKLQVTSAESLTLSDAKQCHPPFIGISEHSQQTGTISLYRGDGNHPDEETMVPWSNGRFLVWDATCMDTFCDSHCQATAKEAGGAAVHAETEKAKKYAHLDRA